MGAESSKDKKSNKDDDFNLGGRCCMWSEPAASLRGDGDRIQKPWRVLFSASAQSRRVTVRCPDVRC
eukprot:3562118-Rhodomonas_salina.2